MEILFGIIVLITLMLTIAYISDRDDKKISFLKKINFDNTPLYYTRQIKDGREYRDYIITTFYTKITPQIVKNWIFFGKKFEINIEKPAFVINDDIESTKLTKDKVRKVILKEVELLNRKEEIEKGELL